MTLLNPLNHEAGSVPFPEDPREIEAALRAGKITYRAFPYMAWRYGKRGVKFTRSDSAWLAWLTRHPARVVEEQIDWLRDVLANRGMPSLILERHLRVLHRQLTRCIPENDPQYRCLLDCADRLERVTAESVSPDELDRLTSEFIACLEIQPGPVLKGTAQLLIVAVADEKSGSEFAVSSLTDWLMDVEGLRELSDLRARLTASERRLLDAETLSSRWSEAIEQTVHQARRC